MPRADTTGTKEVCTFCSSWCFALFEKVTLHSLSLPRHLFVDQAGFELAEAAHLPASASQVMGLKGCATMSACSVLLCPRATGEQSSVEPWFPALAQRGVCVCHPKISVRLQPQVFL